MKVVLYCGGQPKSRTEPSKDYTEIEFSPSYAGRGVDYRIYHSVDGGERVLLASRLMEEREVRQTAAALLALLADR